ncbi:uncharacterized protein EV422DRAFT_433254 [Fimicolochytrium jonesii]|uniref:uncharacterized protein n=1 Tax=Fimicolochytrium jonesii TaxID=1396493 RepID=UPI0022FF3DB0|nr:uncharacterized protein EV422DRAFT_433254 [Fimicolochytrium jonesii]KAI8821818.1 hypothetical protein EV422DRAFT_433254 [Fimicolochytrium jonesii]
MPKPEEPQQRLVTFMEDASYWVAEPEEMRLLVKDEEPFLTFWKDPNFQKDRGVINAMLLLETGKLPKGIKQESWARKAWSQKDIQRTSETNTPATARKKRSASEIDDTRTPDSKNSKKRRVSYGTTPRKKPEQTVEETPLDSTRKPGKIGRPRKSSLATPFVAVEESPENVHIDIEACSTVENSPSKDDGRHTKSAPATVSRDPVPAIQASSSTRGSTGNMRRPPTERPPPLVRKRPRRVPVGTSFIKPGAVAATAKAKAKDEETGQKPSRDTLPNSVDDKEMMEIDVVNDTSTELHRNSLLVTETTELMASTVIINGDLEVPNAPTSVPSISRMHASVISTGFTSTSSLSSLEMYSDSDDDEDVPRDGYDSPEAAPEPSRDAPPGEVMSDSVPVCDKAVIDETSMECDIDIDTPAAHEPGCEEAPSRQPIPQDHVAGSSAGMSDGRSAPASESDKVIDDGTSMQCNVDTATAAELEANEKSIIQPIPEARPSEPSHECAMDVSNGARANLPGMPEPGIQSDATIGLSHIHALQTAPAASYDMLSASTWLSDILVSPRRSVPSLRNLAMVAFRASNPFMTEQIPVGSALADEAKSGMQALLEPVANRGPAQRMEGSDAEEADQVDSDEEELCGFVSLPASMRVSTTSASALSHLFMPTPRSCLEDSLADGARPVAATHLGPAQPTEVYFEAEEWGRATRVEPAQPMEVDSKAEGSDREGDRPVAATYVEPARPVEVDSEAEESDRAGPGAEAPKSDADSDTPFELEDETTAQASEEEIGPSSLVSDSDDEEELQIDPKPTLQAHPNTHAYALEGRQDTDLYVSVPFKINLLECPGCRMDLMSIITQQGVDHHCQLVVRAPVATVGQKIDGVFVPFAPHRQLPRMAPAAGIEMGTRMQDRT